MFESFQESERLKQERVHWLPLVQRGKKRFYIRNIAAVLPLPFFVLGKVILRLFPGCNRSLLVLGAFAIALLLTTTVTTLAWRRGIRITQQAS